MYGTVAMRIAICDSNLTERNRLYRYLKEYTANSIISLYPSFSKLIDDFELGIRYDLVLLDIQKEGIDGFVAAVTLRGICTERSPLILFLSETVKYAFHSFGVTDGYLRKPIVRKSVRRIVDTAQDILTPGMLEIHIPRGSVIQRIHGIIYIEVGNNNYLNIYTTQGDYTTRMTLDEMMARLPSRLFFRTHRSYIVNLSHVRSYDNIYAYFDTGRKVHISQLRRYEFREALNNYIRNNI